MPGALGIALLKLLQAGLQLSRNSDGRLLNREYGGSGDQGGRGISSRNIGYPKLKLIVEAIQKDLKYLKKSTNSHFNQRKQTLSINNAQGAAPRSKLYILLRRFLVEI